MRTKTLLLTAALSVAAAASSMADVFSVNAVGYINLTLNPGFNLIANQLNSSNQVNTLNNVLPSVPPDSLVYTFNNGIYTVDVFDGTQWLDNDTAAPSTTVIPPGKGFFFNNPGSSDITVTLVGEVPQGDSTVSLPTAFSLVSSVVPQQLSLSSNGFPAVPDMLYYSFKNNNYTVLVYDGTQWLNNDTAAPQDATPAVGEGFFINNPGGALNWTRTFNVNQ